MANLRAAYAEVVSNYLTTDAEQTETVEITSDTNDWKCGSTAKLGNSEFKDLINGSTGGSLTITCKDGVVKVGNTTIQGE